MDEELYPTKTSQSGLADSVDRDRSPIEAELERNESILLTIEESLAYLTKKVSPVLNDTLPVNDGNRESVKEPIASGLLGVLQVRNQKLNAINRKIVDLGDRTLL